MQDNIKLVGDLVVEHFIGDTGETDTQKIPNLVVAVGKSWVADRMVEATMPVMGWMSVGTGSSTPVSSNTGLDAEIARVALISTTRVNNTITFVATFSFGVGTGAITEAGIFNDVTAGSMLNRTVFAVINKAANDSITITWNVTVQ